MQVGLLRDVQQGDHAQGSQNLQIFEKMTKFLDEKFQAKISGIEHGWEAEKQTMKKEMDFQRQTITKLEKENLDMKAKLASPPCCLPT